MEISREDMSGIIILTALVLIFIIDCFLHIKEEEEKREDEIRKEKEDLERYFKYRE